MKFLSIFKFNCRNNLYILLFIRKYLTNEISFKGKLFSKRNHKRNVLHVFHGAVDRPRYELNVAEHLKQKCDALLSILLTYYDILLIKH